jgi:hypothetical protein
MILDLIILGNAMNKEPKNHAPLSSLLQTLPREISQRVFHRLDEVIAYEPTIGLMGKTGAGKSREGANKRGNSSRLTQSFHFFMFEPIFSPVNALNQPI